MMIDITYLQLPRNPSLAYNRMLPLVHSSYHYLFVWYTVIDQF